MNPVVHFEMPAEDRKRMSDFYAKAFGWEAQQLGAEMGNYTVVTTSECDPNDPARRPKAPGTINGGFYQRTKEDQGTSVVIAVEDIKAARQRVIDAGGQVLGGMTGEFDDIPGVGLFASFIDTEGNRASMLQPKGM